MGHLKTFFAQGVENLISQISKSSNSRGRPGGGMVKFRIDRYITVKRPDYAPVNVNPRTPPAGTQRGITGEFPVI